KVMHEMDIVWEEVWKKELLRWFILIDEKVASDKPHLADFIGRYTWPFVEESLTILPSSKKTANRKEKGTSGGASKKVAGAKVAKKTAAKQTPWVDPHYDYPLVRFTPASLKRCWEVPIAQGQRADLW